MKILESIVKKKVLVGLLSVMIILLGVLAVFRLGKEIMPSVGADGGYVVIEAGDMAAIDVEERITNTLEQKLLALEDVEKVQSSTILGGTQLDMVFARGKGSEAIEEVERVVNSIQSQHPEIKEAYTGQYGVRGGSEFFMEASGGEMEKMSSFGRHVLKPRLENLKEVQEVNISGMVEHEVSIQLDRQKVAELGLDISQVMGNISESNSEMTLGELASEEKNGSLLRWHTKVEDVDALRKVEIPTADGIITLSDIASVSVEPLANASYVWKNGNKDLIFIQISRATGVTQLDMAKAVRAEVEKIQDEGLVKDFELNEMVAQADFVQESIDGVTDNILIGSIVAVAILLLFLRNVRATLIIGISIPTSVLLTFLTVYLLGYSLNMLTLIGLGLGIGMMVDSSIVILESIYRQKELGLGKLDAVLVGTKEVAGAVVSSMLTTIVVFLPIGFIGGDMGQFMIILSIVVAVTLISSVLVAFTIIPTLSERFLRYRKPKKERTEGKVMKQYGASISWVVAKKWRSGLVIVLFILLFGGSLTLVNKIPMTVMPDIFNRYSEILIELEPGVEGKEKEKVVQKVVDQLGTIEDVDSTFIIDNGNLLVGIINMTKGDEIRTAQKEVNEEILKTLRGLAERSPIKTVQSAMDGLGGAPVQVMIKGENFTELQTIGKDFSKKLASVEGLVGITDSMENSQTQQQVVLKETAIEEAGLTTIQVKQFLQQAFIDMPIGEMAYNEEQIPLMVRWATKANSPSDVLQMDIPTVTGDVKLSSLIELKSIQTPKEIAHIDGERFISVGADIESRDLGAVNRDVQKIINAFDLPAGYAIDAGGDIEQQQQLMIEMAIVLGIAMFLVYFVMAVQFNHLGHPLIVMSVIPMAIIGVIVGLFLTQRELNLLSGMGVIMLIGIVLNNAILLIDRTNQLRREGMQVEEALIAAGKQRIRPIFMTTLTTVGGMLPLALASGASGNYQAPLATVLIAGLLFATIITLVLIPAVYHLVTRRTVVEKETEKVAKKTLSEVVPEFVK
ncbi:efflux RND transporter permease subunit [Sporosarcina sp. Te-1]|uniref:efflux RND transporter permease subunit n=1 Tax=Sporosarcina sp. Te-1 TaxID=2818390 RepID=UPI001A9CD3AB|nr:efflux RND transporter permease subunit [Sporosarcina sp. Te-1]QTD40042.1 efflux RND transporter permease subunit [Sporosarcina sp. Te-1]